MTEFSKSYLWTVVSLKDVCILQENAYHQHYECWICHHKYISVKKKAFRALFTENSRIYKDGNIFIFVVSYRRWQPSVAGILSMTKKILVILIAYLLYILFPAYVTVIECNKVCIGHLDLHDISVNFTGNARNSSKFRSQSLSF